MHNWYIISIIKFFYSLIFCKPENTILQRVIATIIFIQISIFFRYIKIYVSIVNPNSSSTSSYWWYSNTFILFLRTYTKDKTMFPSVADGHFPTAQSLSGRQTTILSFFLTQEMRYHLVYNLIHIVSKYYILVYFFMI